MAVSGFDVVPAARTIQKALVHSLLSRPPVSIIVDLNLGGFTRQLHVPFRGCHCCSENESSTREVRAMSTSVRWIIGSVSGEMVVMGYVEKKGSMAGRTEGDVD